MSVQDRHPARTWRSMGERASETTGIKVSYMLAFLIGFVVPWLTDVAVWVKLLILGAMLFGLATMLWIDRLIYDRLHNNN